MGKMKEVLNKAYCKILDQGHQSEQGQRKSHPRLQILTNVHGQWTIMFSYSFFFERDCFRPETGCIVSSKVWLKTRKGPQIFF